jgi:ribonuclease VapC
MFVDRSVMLAMMTDEADARAFARRMQASTVRLTTPMAVAWTAIALSTRLGLPLAEAGEAVKMFLQLMNIQSVAVPPRAAFLALEAQAAFVAAPAGADLDDCMTYACARYYRQPLLFTGGGFAATDIEIA